MRKAMSIFGLTIGLVILTQPAMAIGWGKESTYYNGVRRATGWGDFRNDGSSTLSNGSRLDSRTPKAARDRVRSRVGRKGTRSRRRRRCRHPRRLQSSRTGPGPSFTR